MYQYLGAKSIDDSPGWPNAEQTFRWSQSIDCGDSDLQFYPMIMKAFTSLLELSIDTVEGSQGLNSIEWSCKFQRALECIRLALIPGESKVSGDFSGSTLFYVGGDVSGTYICLGGDAVRLADADPDASKPIIASGTNTQKFSQSNVKSSKTIAFNSGISSPLSPDWLKRMSFFVYSFASWSTILFGTVASKSPKTAGKKNGKKGNKKKETAVAKTDEDSGCGSAQSGSAAGLVEAMSSHREHSPVICAIKGVISIIGIRINKLCTII